MKVFFSQKLCQRECVSVSLFIADLLLNFVSTDFELHVHLAGYNTKICII